MAGVPQDNPIIQQAAVMGTGVAPSIVLGAAAGTGATFSVVGTNMSGKITLNSGTGVLAAGIVMTLTFANGLTFPTGAVVNYSAGNAAFANVITLISGTTTSSTVTLNVALALSISTTYIGYYAVTGY